MNIFDLSNMVPLVAKKFVLRYFIYILETLQETFHCYLYFDNIFHNKM